MDFLFAGLVGLTPLLSILFLLLRATPSVAGVRLQVRISAVFAVYGAVAFLADLDLLLHGRVADVMLNRAPFHLADLAFILLK